MKFLILITFFIFNNYLCQDIVYVCTNQKEILKLDLNNCTKKSIGYNNISLSDIALTPSGQLYGIDFYTLYLIDTTNANLTYISEISGPESGFNSLMAVDDDLLIGINSNSKIYKIKTNGDTTLIGTLGYYPAGDITQYRGKFYYVDVMNQLIEFNILMEENKVDSIKIMGTLNTPYNSVFGVTTVGEVNCEIDNLRILAFENSELYQVNTESNTTSQICNSIFDSLSLQITGAGSFSETQFMYFDDKLSLPNVFTPNQDNINDYFEPFDNNEALEGEFYIYNRWGDLVYFDEFINFFQWDGKFNGQIVSEGVYFYKLIFSTFCNKSVSKNGYFQVIR